MKTSIVFFILILTNSIFASCQTNHNQREDVNKIVHSKEEWDKFLKIFPTKKIEFLDSLQYYRHLKDTISIDLVNRFFWSDSIPTKYTRKDGSLKYKLKVAPSVYKGYEFLFPCCGNASKEPFKMLNDNDEECSTFSKVFPLAKIFLPNDYIMIIYSYVSGWEVFYRVTIEVINKNFEKTGHWGFLYGAEWNNCNDTLYEIGKKPTPYSYPVNVSVNGFDVIDNVIENEYNEEILQTFWKVIINEKGQFEIVREKKIYEDKIELWSKRGYRIQDTDGFTNLRAKPTTSGKVISKLTNGTLVTIIDASKDWWLIKTAAHQKGFIHKSRIVEGH